MSSKAEEADAANLVSVPTVKRSRIISTVLAPAVKLWLRSQLEQATDLQVNIATDDRQLLSGAIEQISVVAQNAIYQGLHLTQAHLCGQQIQINIGQILRGKPLNFLAAFSVSARVQLTETDLNASLQAPLLANAVTTFLLTLLQADLPIVDDRPITLQTPQIVLGLGRLTLTAKLVSASGNITPVVIRTGLEVESGQWLKLDRPEWLPHANAQRGLQLHDLDGFAIDLSNQVSLNELTLEPNQITCSGEILVTPNPN